MRRNGPVPIIPLATQVPGLFAIAAGWMIAWYVVWLISEGIAAFGEFRWKATVYFPTFRIPDGSRSVFGIADRSCEVFWPVYCLKLATTSSAVISLPLWKLTPRRSWNVHTVPFLFGFQLVANHGFTWSAAFEKVRNSPGIPASPSDPASRS